jgi:hypothetical protein
VVLLKPNQRFNLGAFWNKQDFILNNEVEVSVFDKNSDTYVFLSENIVFGMLRIVHQHPFVEKYRAAIESDVIVINISDYKNADLGDLWNGKEVCNIERVEK